MIWIKHICFHEKTNWYENESCCYLFLEKKEENKSKKLSEENKKIYI
jgi:hypothetical protein